MKYYHWADKAAIDIIEHRGDKGEYTIEAGITPSGTIHMGNFREIITADFIKRALEEKGKKVKFLYVWDDYDVLRKVPSNLPEQDMIKENLRKPVYKVPDPYGTCESYSRHFEKEVEDALPKVGIYPTYVYSHELYMKCKFSEEIKVALEKTSVIKGILDKYRKEPLSNDWLPIFVFDEETGRDTNTDIKWDGKYTITYTNELGKKCETNFRKKGLVTLRWRVDWPMRWHVNKVDFESAGKDHFAAGGSVDTARQIQKAVYGSEHPRGFVYEWISIKGGGEFASSKGKVITLAQMLEVYEPEIVRYLFASTRPEAVFAISFDLDVIKIYEDFDKCERIYFGNEKVDEKEEKKQKRIYELSMTEKVPLTMPERVPLRHITTVIQTNEFNLDNAMEFFKSSDPKLRQRMECARNWLEKHAPDNFKFSVQDEPKADNLSDKQKVLIRRVYEMLSEELDADKMNKRFFEICREEDVKVKDFFETIYRVIIAKKQGPKLAAFINQIGRERVRKILSKVI